MTPTPPRPVLTQKELWDAYDSTRTHADGLRAIESAVLAKGDGERETCANQRAYEALTKLASYTWMQRDGMDAGVLRFRDTHYAPPAPERVTLSDGSELCGEKDGTLWRLTVRTTDGTFIRSRLVEHWLELVNHASTGADFDALKAFASRLAAQGEK